MTLRRLFIANAIVLSLLGLGAPAALVAITTAMLRDNTQASMAIEGFRAAAEIEVGLLVHHTEGRLYQLTGEPSRAQAMAEATARIQRGLVEARSHIDSSAEELTVRRLTRDVQSYLGAAHKMGPSPAEDHALTRLMAQAVATSDELQEINLQDARHSLQQSLRLRQAANGIALGAASFIVVGIGTVIASARRGLYRPLASIRAGIGRFRDGNMEARIPEDGPAELREIAFQFNEMASALARERENRLGFLAGVAHDLRDPLNVLRITAYRLGGGGRSLSPERATEMLALVTTQVDRLNRMVEDLLDTARIEAGKLDIRLEEKDAREVVRESVDLHRLIGSDHQWRLSVPDVPVPILCDAYRIAQVLNNILSNAIKYSPRGGTVDVRVDRDGDFAVVSVADEGVGIHPDDLRRIFDPFQRGSATDVPGVGLGLSVARRIVLAHGGQIQVRSRQGAGTTFEVRLPAPGPA